MRQLVSSGVWSLPSADDRLAPARRGSTSRSGGRRALSGVVRGGTRGGRPNTLIVDAPGRKSRKEVPRSNGSVKAGFRLPTTAGGKLGPAQQSAGAFLLVYAVFRARDRASKAGDRRRAEARRPLGPYCRQIGARPPQRKNIPSGTHPW